MQSQSMLCRVAVSVVNYAIDLPYTYLLPAPLCSQACPGVRVLIPFGRGNRRTEGLILEIVSEEPHGKLKPVLAVLDEVPVLDRDGIQLALWMQSRFFCTVYDAVKAMLPAGLYFSLQDCYCLRQGISQEAALDAAANEPERRVIQLLALHPEGLSAGKVREAFAPVDPSRALRRLLDCGILTLETYTARNTGDKTEQIAVLAISAEDALAKIDPKKQPAQHRVMEHLAKYPVSSVKDICYFCGTSQSVVKTLEKKGLLRLTRRELFRRPDYQTLAPMPPPKLNAAQEQCFQGLSALMDEPSAQCALLYGVTGSGKTQVYIQLIRRAIAQSRSALVLVPEIALTPQLLALFSAQFGEQIAVLHSSLSPGQRYDEWKRIRQGRAQVVIGTRSAVFAPLSNLGLLILDEEQEASYKSESAPRYHARDVAKFRAVQHRALLVLGSATPAVESMYYARTGTYHLFRLDERFNHQAMPKVLIADLKQQLRSGNDSLLSDSLCRELEQNLNAGDQSILFLNRRGTSRMAVCVQCGEAPGCPRCSVRLTYHKANGRLMCHHCGHSEPLPASCPACGGELVFVGAGTQMVEEELNDRFPGAEVLRMDADTISASQTHEQILQRFQQKKIPILLGTQMIAKGLDFDGVTLVGVINADQSLYTEDFRAAERTFSLLTQVVGRSGRGGKAGRAVIQTYTPKNDVILCAAEQDYDQFYAHEIALREKLGLPPFRDVFQLTVSGTQETHVLQACMRLRDGAAAWQVQRRWNGDTVQILGPAAAPVLKVNGKYRYRISVYGRSEPAVRQMVAHLLRAAQKDPYNRHVSVTADFNPVNG